MRGPLLETGASAGELGELLGRYDPGVRRRRRGRFLVAGGVVVTWRRGVVGVAGSDRLARGIGRHLGGRWRVPPAEPGERDELIEDMLRIYVPRKLVPAEVATAVRAVLPGVVIRDDPRLGCLWFDDEDSELTVSAWVVEPGTAVPVVVGEHEVLYECGVDDVQGPTEESAEEGWRIAGVLGGVAVDRYGFRVTGAEDLRV